MTDDFAGDEGDPSDVRVAVLPTEAEALREVRADDIPIEERHFAASFPEACDQCLGDRRFARAAEAGQPHAEAPPWRQRAAGGWKKWRQRRCARGMVRAPIRRFEGSRCRADFRQHELENASPRGLDSLAAGIDAQGRTGGG